MTGFLNLTFWGAKKHKAGLVVTAAPPASSSTGLGPVTSAAFTATATGGTAPYTYLWSFLPGSSGIMINSPTAATTTTSTILSPGDFIVGYMICTVTDNVGTVVASNQVNIQFTASGASHLLTTMTLVNTGGSTQAANFITPVFGMTFKKGDIPPGTAPTFTIGSTVQPYSWGLQSYYGDGSLRHASFMFRCSSSIAGSGTLTIAINSGGTAPSASSRTLTEVYAQNLSVGGTGIGTFGGLSTSDWRGYLTSDGNNTEQYVYMDGQAGKTWRIKTHMATSSGGAAHGQLEVYHYITALQDNSGNLGGFRHIARINQPYYNQDAPTKGLRAFSSISTQYGSGPTTIPLTWPFTNINFTGTNGSDVLTVAAAGTHNLYSGAQSGSGSAFTNCVPGYLSATTDAAFSAGQLYFAYTYGPADNNTVFKLTENTTGITYDSIQSSGGTSTFVPIPNCMHAGSIYTADSQGRSNFFQGTGSMSADNTVRTQFDRTYLHSTGAVPPYNLSSTGTAFGGTIKDIPAIVDTSARAYWGGSPTWNPVTVGPLSPAWRGGPGSNLDLSPLTGWHAAHFYNQTAVSDMAVRSMTFAAANDGIGIRDVATGNYPNVNNLSYTGLPAPSTNQQSVLLVSDNDLTGWTTIPSTPSHQNTSFLWGGDQNNSHKPSMSYYGFLIFGEPYFYDLMIEDAQGALLEGSEGAFLRVPTNPAGYGILMTYSEYSLRCSAWSMRDLMLGAYFAAAASPDGSQINNYLNDLVNQNMTYTNALFSSTYVGSTLAAHNGWLKVDYTNAFPDFACGGFQMSYFENIVAWMAALGNSAALTWLNTYVTWQNFILTTYGGYHLYPEYALDNTHSVDGPNHGTVLTSLDQYAIPCNMTGALNWQNSTSPNFSFAAPAFGYVVSAGDKIVFMNDILDRQVLPSGFSVGSYYIRDVSGNNFNFASSPGGTPITPGDSGTIIMLDSANYLDASSPGIIMANPPATSTGQIPSYTGGAADSYLLYKSMAWNWAIAVGATGYSSLLADANARLAAIPPDYTVVASWYGQSTL